MGCSVGGIVVSIAAFQNLWDAAKAILRAKLIAIQSYFKKQEKFQINNLTLHLKELGK